MLEQKQAFLLPLLLPSTVVACGAILLLPFISSISLAFVMSLCVYILVRLGLCIHDSYEETVIKQTVEHLTYFCFLTAFLAFIAGLLWAFFKDDDSLLFLSGLALIDGALLFCASNFFINFMEKKNNGDEEGQMHDGTIVPTDFGLDFGETTPQAGPPLAEGGSDPTELDPK
ncbi:MAG: hypothetical protein OXU73_00500 [Candidatus Campbellbacteria bacterium]|nr:hypothetical protein [Candidatus Campbellbacteria bacterium]